MKKLLSVAVVMALAGSSALAAEGKVARKAVFAGGRGDAECAAVCAFSGRENPKVLVCCSAFRDMPRNIAALSNSFAKAHATVEPLKLFNCPPADRLPAIREKILGADIVWFDGGATEDLARALMMAHVEDTLRVAYANGTVLAGYSAGGIILSHAGLTDFPRGRYDLVEGLGVIDCYYCPHYEGGDAKSWKGFDKRLEAEKDATLPATAYAVEDGTMVLWTDGKPEFKKLNPKRNVHKFTRTDGVWKKETVEVK